MAWKTELVQLVRNIIGDISLDSPTYTDERLYEVILTSAQLLQGDVDFSVDYTIDIDQCTLSPDPTTTPKDNDFINLVALRTSCIISNSEFRTAANKAYNFVDGPSKIDGRDVAESTYKFAETICKAFENAKKAYRAGNSTAGAIIVSPYRVYDTSYTRKR
jgi:hypothetical protein